MLVPMNSLICPITYEIAQEPVYLKNCFHAFDRDNIAHWVLEKLAERDSVSCPTCRYEYPLEIGVNEDRETAIVNLCQKILSPVLVPSEINEMVEIVSANLPEGREATKEEAARIIQDVVANHLHIIQKKQKLIVKNRKLKDKLHQSKAKVDRLQKDQKKLMDKHEERMDQILAKILEINSTHEKDIADLKSKHRTRVCILNKNITDLKTTVEELEKGQTLEKRIIQFLGSIVGAGAVAAYVAFPYAKLG